MSLIASRTFPVELYLVGCFAVVFIQCVAEQFGPRGWRRLRRGDRLPWRWVPVLVVPGVYGWLGFGYRVLGEPDRRMWREWSSTLRAWNARLWPDDGWLIAGLLLCVLVWAGIGLGVAHQARKGGARLVVLGCDAGVYAAFFGAILTDLKGT